MPDAALLPTRAKRTIAFRPILDLLPAILLILAFALVPPTALALHSPFWIHVFTRIMILAVVAVALNLIIGFSGLVSLLHAGLFGIGGYVVAILAYHDVNATPFLALFPGTSDLAISLPLSLLASGAAAALLGAVSLRTSGVYFIMITLAFNQMIHYFFSALQSYGGDDGLQVLSTLTFAGWDITERIPLYYVCLAVLAGTLVFVGRLVESRFGLVLRGTAQNERRIVALGIPPWRYKLTAFVISGILSGLAGALWVASEQFISPADMSWIRSGDFIVMIVLGGISLTWGPVLGTAAFLVLELMLSSWTTFWQLPFGIIIILIVTFLHRGLVDLWSLFIRVGRYLRRD